MHRIIVIFIFHFIYLCTCMCTYIFFFPPTRKGCLVLCTKIYGLHTRVLKRAVIIYPANQPRSKLIICHVISTNENSIYPFTFCNHPNCVLFIYYLDKVFSFFLKKFKKKKQF